jgi:hypothetical protein
MNETIWLPGVFFECGDYHYIIGKDGDQGYFGEVVGIDPFDVLHTTPTRKRVITVHRLCSRWVSKQIIKSERSVICPTQST